MEVKIKSVDCVISLNGLTNIIKNINWEYSNENISINGIVELQEPNLDNFIPFEEITNTILIEWVNKVVDFTSYNDSIVNIENVSPEIVTLNIQQF